MIGQARAVLKPVGCRRGSKKNRKYSFCTRDDHHGNKNDLIAITAIATTGNARKQEDANNLPFAYKCPENAWRDLQSDVVRHLSDAMIAKGTQSQSDFLRKD